MNEVPTEHVELEPTERIAVEPIEEAELEPTPSLRDRLAARKGYALWILLGLVVLAGLGLRLYGIGWDQNYHFHPDERAVVDFVGKLGIPKELPGGLGQLLDAKTSPLNPHWFNYGTFPLYVIRAVAAALVGLTGDLSLATYDKLYFVGRALSAVFDSGTVLLVFFLGARLYDRRVGLLAATFAAFSVIQIQLAHFLTVDILLTLLIVATVFFAAGMMRAGSYRSAVMAGVFLGLALATKVSVIPLFATVALAAVLYCFAGDRVSLAGFEIRRVERAVGLVLVAAAVGALFFFLGEPFAFLDNQTFMRHVNEQSDMVRRVSDLPYTRQYVNTTPYLYHVQQLAVWGLGLPLGIAGWGSLLVTAVAAGLVRRKGDLVVLSWAVVYFGPIGFFDVKFLRYMLPLSPFLVLLAARWLLALWRWQPAPLSLPTILSQWERIVGRDRLVARWVAGGLTGFVVLSTIFYGVAYDRIYAEPHTAVQVGRWLQANAPRGAVLVKEHWEEAVPNLGDFRYVDLGNYEPDDANKLRKTVEQLRSAQYLVFFSNRLYGTIPRLPDRYPMTTRFYRTLMNGDLGFELSNFAASYPNLLGVSFVDDTFGRPGLPVPAPLADFRPAPISLNLGYADESFTVYDHPKVLLFKKTRQLSDAEMASIIGPVPGPIPPAAVAGKPVKTEGLLLSEADRTADQAGGTWSQLFDRNGLPSQAPLLVWLLFVELLALLALPLTLAVFQRLPDRGYLLAKPLSVLLLAYLAWLAASLHVLPYTRLTIFGAAAVIGLVSLFVLERVGGEILAFLRSHWRLVAIGEAVFLLAFLGFYLLRIANPDLWHPYRGGEKPMDFAYLNAIIKTTYFPPYDPWFAGGYINYYYFGQTIAATLIKATGTVPEIGLNLVLPLMFALAFGGAFSVGYNLLAARLSSSAPRPTDAETEGHGDAGTRGRGDAETREETISISVSPRPPFPASPRPRVPASAIAAGLMAGLLVSVAGNLDGLFQLAERLTAISPLKIQSGIPGVAEVVAFFGGAWATLLQGKPIAPFDFWRSSRMIPGTNNITEFPYFTFLFADPHAHLYALPFTVLAIGLALAVALPAVESRRQPAEDAPEELDLATVAGGSGEPVLAEGEVEQDGEEAAEGVEESVAAEPTVTTPTALAAAMIRIGELLARVRPWVGSVRPAHVALLALLGLDAGALRAANSWDYPTYLLIAAAAIALGQFVARRRINPGFAGRTVLGIAVVYLLSNVLWLPFVNQYELFYTGIDPSPEKTPIHNYLAVHGFFLFAVFSFVVAELYRQHRLSAPVRIARLWLRYWETLPHVGLLTGRLVHVRRELWLASAYGLALLGLIVFVLVLFKFALVALVFVLLLVVAGLALSRLIRQPDGFSADVFVLILVGAALGLGAAVDLITLKGDIGRMNTVFKFYLQAWVMLAIASAYALAWLLRPGAARLVGVVRRRGPNPLAPFPEGKGEDEGRAGRGWRAIWLGALAILVFAISLYPLLATPVRLRDRFNPLPPTPDGMAYMEKAVFREDQGQFGKGDVLLSYDRDAIVWMQDHVEGSPPIAEAFTGLYRWGSRVSIYTGLPTIIGWDWHQTQQRFGYQQMIRQRLDDLQMLYNTADPQQALGVLRKYGVRYVYVGQLERFFYPPAGLQKFDRMVGGDLEVAYENPQVKIYRVKG